MNKNFNFFTVSIFCDCDYKDIVSAIYQIKKTQIESNKIEIREEKSIIEEYYNPPSGGAHLPQFTCWESEKYPNKVFFISNYEDGLYTLCKAIHRIVGKILIICSLSNKTNISNPFFQLYYSDSNLNERSIMAYKDERWIFYEEGTPLYFENICNYKNKYIKRRLNNDIIIEYLKKLGIDLWEIDQSIVNSTAYKQNRW